MGKDKIRYLIFINGRWRWRPSKVMRAAGFQLTNLGPGKVVDGRRVASQEDKERALRLNAAWDCIRRGAEEFTVVAKAYPPGPVGEAWERIMQLRARERLDAGKSWTREQQSRDDWHRAWRHFGPLFGDTDPRTIRPEHFIGDPAKPDELGLKTLIARKVSDREAHRVIKVWRAFWKKMAALGYCDLDRDPSKLVRNSAAPPRQAMWREGEAVRLVKAAWRAGFESLAALLAVAWDSQLSPVDARSIKAHQMRRDAHGMWFDIARAKTGRSALATLSRRTEVVLGHTWGHSQLSPWALPRFFATARDNLTRKTHWATIFASYASLCSVLKRSVKWPTSDARAVWRRWKVEQAPTSCRARWPTRSRLRVRYTRRIRQIC